MIKKFVGFMEKNPRARFKVLNVNDSTKKRIPISCKEGNEITCINGWWRWKVCKWIPMISTKKKWSGGMIGPCNTSVSLLACQQCPYILAQNVGAYNIDLKILPSVVVG